MIIRGGCCVAKLIEIIEILRFETVYVGSLFPYQALQRPEQFIDHD